MGNEETVVRTNEVKEFQTSTADTQINAHQAVWWGLSFLAARAKRAAESSLRFFSHQFNVGNRALKGLKDLGCCVGQNDRLEMITLSSIAAMQGP